MLAVSFIVMQVCLTLDKKGKLCEETVKLEL